MLKTFFATRKYKVPCQWKISLFCTVAIIQILNLSLILDWIKMKAHFEVYLTWGAPQILNSWKLIGFKTVIIAGRYLSHLCGRGVRLGVDGWFTGGLVQLIVHCCPLTGHREDVVVTVRDCRRWQIQVPPLLSSRRGRGSWWATTISGLVATAIIFL